MATFSIFLVHARQIVPAGIVANAPGRRAENHRDANLQMIACR
jgi:hypothetical protein